jgi:serine/threonine protein kinase
VPSEPAPNGGPTRFDRAAEIFHEVRSLGLVERQALANMDHPNIAKVFDGGATDSGRPHFVMELVKGVPITE